MTFTENTPTVSHSGPWRRYSCDCGCGDVHVVPGLERRKHLLIQGCWCHPSVEMQDEGEVFLHNVAQ